MEAVMENMTGMESERRASSIQQAEEGKDPLSEGPFLLGLRGPAYGAQRKSYHQQDMS